MTINTPADKLIYLDIETATGEKSYQELVQKNPKLASCYADKTEVWKNGRPQDAHKSIDDLYTDSAALVPEFGMIVCVSIGGIFNGNMRSVSYVVGEGNIEGRKYYPTEKDMLRGFIMACVDLKNKWKKGTTSGFNVKKFDFPYLFRRCLINGLALPSFIFDANAKPWNQEAVDLYSVYCAGHSYGANLDTVSTLFGLPSPKDNGMHGSEVSKYFYEGKIDEIANYCEGDIAIIPQLIEKFNDLEYFE